MDGFDGGFALSFLFIIMSITGIIVIIMYSGRARALDGILSGDKILAHWRYTSDEWREYTEKDYRMEKHDKWGLYRLVMIITAVVTFGFWLFHHDSGVIMVVVFIGLGVLLSGVILLTTSYDHWQNTKYQGEVYIARDGAYVGRKLRLWKGWGARLDDLKYDEPKKLLLFSYSMPSQTGRDSATVRIEVPPGQEEKARQIIAELSHLTGTEPSDI
jgi:hypothetical protein